MIFPNPFFRIHIKIPKGCFDVSGKQEQTDNAGAVKAKEDKNRKGRKRITEITVERVNEPLHGLLEKALADIYARKIKNGTLSMD